MDMKPVRTKTFVALAVALYALWPAKGAPARGAPQTAPDFTLHQCVRADSIRLADHLEGPVLLVFYDSGFVTNVNTLRYVREWHRRYSGDGLRIIPIHSPLLEPSKNRYNAIEVVGAQGLMMPVGLDMEREVTGMYGISGLPSFVLIRPGGRIAAAFTGEKVYEDVERAVQEELKRLSPDIILPLIMKPVRPWDDPEARLLPATPMVMLGYAGGKIANADSSLLNDFAVYSDARRRTEDVVFLNGRWKVGEHSITHSDSAGGLNDHVRIIYKAKSVYVLPLFELGTRPRVYIKQDRTYLDPAVWGSDVMGDQKGRPYIYMQYSIPQHIVANPAFGKHQLELIVGEGDVSFCYLFFEADVQN
jgi:peroxiredoxin